MWQRMVSNMLGFVEILFCILVSIILIGIILALILFLIALGIFAYGVLTGKENAVTKWVDEN